MSGTSIIAQMTFNPTWVNFIVLSYDIISGSDIVSGLQIRVHIGKLFSLFLIQNICCGYSKESSRALDKPALRVKYKKNGRICIYLNSCAYHDENQNKDYATNVFSDRNVRNAIFYFVFTRLGKVEEIRLASLRACSFYYRVLAILRNRILNIDQLEMKHMLVSGRSIV